jgi:TolA-binding protein
MSDEDTLETALRAMREGTDGAHSGAAATRLQILERSRRERRARRRTVAIVLPLAAAFVASVAWGAVTGRLSRWLFPSNPATAPPYASTSAPSGRPGEADGSPATAPSSDVADAGSATEGGGALVAEVVMPAAASPSASAVVPTSASRATPSAASASSAEQELYSTAHRAHFEEHDSSAALRGWNAYLASYPNGHFALEARYNRAICLVRLGRRDDARKALGPFAGGAFGGYRQREATELLEALAPRDGG